MNFRSSFTFRALFLLGPLLFFPFGSASPLHLPLDQCFLQAPLGSLSFQCLPLDSPSSLLPPGFICYDETKLNITIFKAGGTISANGTQNSTLYQSGVLNLEIVANSANVCNIANIRIISVYEDDSINLHLPLMLEIARKIEIEVNNPYTHALVVAGGTDAQDELIAVVHQTVHTLKAIVFTGAILAATATDADGPKNLSDAVRLGLALDARHRGLLVMFNGHILIASLTFKANANHFDAFQAHPGGHIGQMINNKPIFTIPAAQPFKNKIFNITTIPINISVPHVRIAYAHAGMNNSGILNGVDVLVGAAFGTGYWPESDTVLKEAGDLGIPIVISSRVRLSYVEKHPPCGYGIGAGLYNPQQAAVLVSLCLIVGLGHNCMEEVLKHGISY
ncbi:Asparaginase/glutaminase [Mariannaea sp. PMI_226]|nr:Asparaginase/glutaminase [Mariannaea sp. PMI_226]